MNKAGRVIIGGAALGALAWYVYNAMQPVAADTADGEGSGWDVTAWDAWDMVSVGYGGNDMQISLAGINLIKSVEGYRADPYKDSAGLWTGGYGHKFGAMEKVESKTEAEWSRILAADVADAESTVNSSVKVTLLQNQFDALVSFVYNVGGGAFRRSTLLKKINAGDLSGAVLEFGRWNVAGGKVSSGLTNRRLAEANYFKKTGPIA